MNTALWVVAIVAALISFAAGINKLSQSKADLQGQDNMGWTEEFSDESIKRIGAIELVGVFGLILPQASHRIEILTPIAACGLILLQLGAVYIHVRRHEPKILIINIPLILALLYVAIGRFIHG